MNTMRLTSAGAIVRFLKSQYVSRDGENHRLIRGMFGIFGHGNVAGLGQALEEHGGIEFPFYQPKNEQSMVHAAVAFSKARRRLGTFACTTSIGPGATNLVTGAATATINHLPVLLLPGDVFSNRSTGTVLQQLENPASGDISVNDCLKPVSRYWDRIHRPEQLLHALPEAMRVLSQPAQMGAVTLALPQDVQAEAYEFPISFFEKRVHPIFRRIPSFEEIQIAIQKIRSAKSPLIVVGGGVFYSDAGQSLLEFSNATGVPVCFTQAGKSIGEEGFENSLGALGVTGTLAANAIADEADLVVVIGTRLTDFTTASRTQFKNPQVKFISINLNPLDAFKHAAFPLVSDARATLDILSRELKDFRVSIEFRQRVSHLRKQWSDLRADILHAPPASEAPLTQAQTIGILNEHCDPKSVIVHAAGGLPGDLHKLWNSRSDGNYHSEYGYSCMGYEIAGALGVKMADPSREVYALVGDGSYLMLNHEIATSLQEGVKITVVLLDNHGYQCIHGLQKSCGSKSFGNEFRKRTSSQQLDGEPLSIDYVANAKSLGAETHIAGSRDALTRALLQSAKAVTTTLIYVPLQAGAPIPGFSWWEVPISEVSEEADVQKARAKYEAQQKNKRNFF